MTMTTTTTATTGWTRRRRSRRKRRRRRRRRRGSMGGYGKDKRGQDRRRKEWRWQFAVSAPTTNTGATNSLPSMYLPSSSRSPLSVPSVPSWH